MATNRWQAKAQTVAQVNTVTPVAANAATYTLTINGKSVTYTSDASATVAEITAGLVDAWAAETEGEMTEVTAADITTALTLTAVEEGRPFTQTSSSSAGSLTTSTTTANVSPNDANNATNWTDGVPTAADDLILDAGGEDQGLWWNLGALSAITLTTFTRRRAFTGKVGLPEYNEEGANPFLEYRATEFAISATTWFIEQPASDEAEQIKLNGGSAQSTVTVLGDGNSELGEERLWWRGTHASNVLNAIDASVAIAPVNANAATIATLRGERATIRCGSGVTLTTVTNLDSLMEFNSNVTTLTQKGEDATTYFKGSAALTTANIHEGTLVWQSSGTITTLTPGGAATIDFSQGSGPVTVTNAVTLPRGVTILDPNGRVTWSGGLVLGTGVRLEDVTLDLGTGRTLTVA